MLVWGLVLIAGSAEADKSEPTEAEQRWINAFYKFVETGEAPVGILNEKKLVRESLRTFRLDAKQLGMFDSLRVSDRLLGSMWDSMADDTWVSFLRMREVEGGRVALFRLSGDGGLNYIEWYLESKPDGEVWAWDANIYVSGERLTQTLQRMWLPAVAQLDEQVRKHMGRRNRELAKHLLSINAMRVASNEGNHAKVIEIYEAMPESVQHERVCIVQAMDSYFESGDEKQYRAMLELFLELHGEASNRELMLMDVYIYREEYDKSIQMVDDLDKRVGGDPFLYSFRAGIAYASGDYAKTKRYHDAGIKAAPEMDDFYWEAIDFAIGEEDWPRVSEMLDGVQAQGTELYPLKDVEGYEGYVASDEYQRWLSRQTQAVQNEQRAVPAEEPAE